MDNPAPHGLQLQTVVIWWGERLFGFRVQPLSGRICVCNGSEWSPWISQRNRRRLWNWRVGAACPDLQRWLASVCMRVFVLMQFSYLCQPREKSGGSFDRFLPSSPPFCKNVLHVGPSPSYRNLSPGCLSVSSLMCLLIISVVVMATYDRSYGVREVFFFFLKRGWYIQKNKVMCWDRDAQGIDLCPLHNTDLHFFFFGKR